jgi:divalent metal cation (Fe/Co/Zn/Cd) transporter
MYKFLVIIKTVAAVISKSLSVISSVVDSAVDLLSSIILIWTARQISKRDAYQYPTGQRLQDSIFKQNSVASIGRTRLEPIAVVILAVIMCSASIQVITESGQTLSDDIEYLSRPFNASSCKKLPDIRMSAFPIAVMGLTIGEFSLIFWS